MRGVLIESCFVKSFDELMSIYGKTHQNPVNIKVHMICVPAIFLSIVGVLSQLPWPFDFWLAGGWATVAMLPAFLTYFRLRASAALWMGLVYALCLCLIDGLAQLFPGRVLVISVAIFVVAWIGQFWGHHVEGKRPSFFHDLVFLLIGPLWVLRHLRVV